jgi:GNAT superfamily N-acetyltransferase
MPVELIPAKREHLSDVARICHLAFNTLHQRHQVAPDFPTQDAARAAMDVVLRRPDYPGVVAVEGGRILGSNFLMLADEVAGVGPITVEPGEQSRGVGRLLMQWAIDEARRRRGDRPHVRLFQESVNAASLSLYTRLGFRWRDSAAVMFPEPRKSTRCRPLTADDLDDVERLSVETYGYSRRNDAARLLEMGIPGTKCERHGRNAAYHFATLFGHGAAETGHDLIEAAAHTASGVDRPVSVTIVPMSQDLFAAALDAGFRVAKTLSYMSLETYRPPKGPCTPSILC